MAPVPVDAEHCAQPPHGVGEIVPAEVAGRADHRRAGGDLLRYAYLSHDEREGRFSGTAYDITADPVVRHLEMGGEQQDQTLVRMTHRHFAIFRTRVKPNRANNSSGPVCR